MGRSLQDQHYLEVEADAFFERNNRDVDPDTLRATKRSIVEAIDACGIKPRRVLEYGCNYGDLLKHYADLGAECHGVEPSRQAIEFGRKSYGSAIHLCQGTLADNPINASLSATGGDASDLEAERYRGYFDLVVIEDVFCWVSRETLFQSIANVDTLLADGGHLFIREFAALSHSKNRNHHVEEAEVYCFKPAMTHADMLAGSGVYATIYHKLWMDRLDTWVESAEQDPFQSRWSDTVLRKSLRDYYR
ncbi:MAG: methyltransferase domain-containing protein [Deltaproteobacteria bacterium]|nr:methyltransferase domain-containing protein [Deltaproteobacteria bacterium]MBW2725609.1 methyltransferase domain-containing protein [Deltaproteobacteria bacterium]